MAKDNEDAFGGFGGWDDLNNVGLPVSPEEQHAQAQSIFEFDQSVHRTFSTPDGQITLEWMRQIATGGRRMDPETDGDGIKCALAGFFREGQAAFFFDVRNRMARAEQGPPHMAGQDGANTARPKPTRKKG